MYDKLIEKLRDDSMLENCEFDFVHKYMHEAADAIEELQNQLREEKVANVNLTGWLAEEHAKQCPHYIRNVHDRGDDSLCTKWECEVKALPKWIMFESRPMDEEERQYFSEHYGYELADDEAVIYCSQLPEHDQEVLVCNKYGNIWIDRYDDDPDYGVGFETNGDMDGLVAWMPLPQPPEVET